MAKGITVKELLSAEDSDALISELSFENGLKLLEELVEKVESGSLALDSAVNSYEKGVAIIAKLRSLLEGAEAKLKVLKKE